VTNAAHRGANVWDAQRFPVCQHQLMGRYEARGAGENIGLNILRPEIACGNADNITNVLLAYGR